MAVSIFHIGLPLDHPSIPVEERPKIAKRLSDLQERMTRAGYKYEITHASPETGLDAFKHRLRTQPCDGVLIGGAVAGDPAMSYFMEQIIDATHEVVPKAKIMFHNHSVDVRESVERWFGPQVNMKKSDASQGQSPSQLISQRIAELEDWRGETLGTMRKLIQEADPDVVEEWKWRGTPVWSHDGIVCTGESYKKVVKLTFAKGASLNDPARLFNSSLDGNVRRAIDIHEGEEVDRSAFQGLIRQAVALNSSGKSKSSKKGNTRAVPGFPPEFASDFER